MSESRYKFDAHFLKLSRSDDLHMAKTEWRIIYREEREERTGLCICQHKIKNIIYMYNIFTKYTISVGSTCYKKINCEIINFNNSIFRNVMNKMIRKGKYKIINNILEYTNNIQAQLIKYIKNKYKKNIANTEKIKKLNGEIHDLINKYDLKYLQDLYDEINKQIVCAENAKLEKEAKERIKLEKEANERVKLDREAKERIKLEKEAKERIKLEVGANERIKFEKKAEEHIIPKIKCACGIEKQNLSACENSKYILDKLSDNPYCVSCNKWKCRCK
jgi:hypothetical protein